MRQIIIIQLFILVVHASFSTATATQNETLQTLPQEIEEIPQSDDRDSIIKDLREKQKMNEALIKQLQAQINFQTESRLAENLKSQSQIDFHKQTIERLIENNKLFENYDKCKDELADKSSNLEICQFQVNQLNSSCVDSDEKIIEYTEKLQNILKYQQGNELNLKMSEVKLAQAEIHQKSCEAELEALKTRSNNNIPASCIPFAEYSGVHQIKVSGMDAFDVLCDSQFAGSGWIVIQQRVGGDENFNRDWNSYRDGFGSFDGDFFLGLEKIHLLTKWRRFELFIHLVNLKGGVRHARYDAFKLSDEEHGYALQLGGFSGNVWEALASSDRMKFSTFDRDNDASTHNCADLYKSGWWYSNCYNSNLNALYGPDLHWFKSQPIKEAKMLIRPRD